MQPPKMSPNIDSVKGARFRRKKVEELLEIGYWPVCRTEKASHLFVTWDIPTTHGPQLLNAADPETMQWVPVWVHRITRIFNGNILESWAAMTPEYKVQIAEVKERYDALKNDREQRLILLGAARLKDRTEGVHAEQYNKALNAAITIERNLRKHHAARET
jgi:hypothetical protein